MEVNYYESVSDLRKYIVAQLVLKGKDQYIREIAEFCDDQLFDYVQVYSDEKHLVLSSERDLRYTLINFENEWFDLQPPLLKQ